jgi:hypothetical protein
VHEAAFSPEVTREALPTVIATAYPRAVQSATRASRQSDCGIDSGDAPTALPHPAQITPGGDAPQCAVHRKADSREVVTRCPSPVIRSIRALRCAAHIPNYGLPTLIHVHMLDPNEL